MNIKLTFAATAITAGLLLTTLVPVSADEQATEKRHGYAGTLKTFQDGDLVIERNGNRGSTLPISVTDETEIKWPGSKTPVEDLGEIAIGARLAALVLEHEDGSLEALQVLVLPEKPTVSSVTGAVISIVDGVMTIALPNGETKEVRLGRGQDEPELGEVVIAFSKDEDGDESTPPEATGLARADEVRARLQDQIGELAENPGQGASEEARRKALSRLSAALESHVARHTEILSGLLERPGFPEAGKAGIQKALAAVEDRQPSIDETVEKGKSEAASGRDSQQQTPVIPTPPAGGRGK